MGKRAANRYAKALIDFGIENKSLDKLFKDINDISASIHKSSDLRAILKSPVVKSEDKLAILNTVFKKSDKILLNLFQALSYHNRYDHLSLICDAFVHLYNKVNNIQEAHIRSAVELDKSALAAFNKKIKDITGDDAKITTSVEKDLLGGFILNINNLQYDASISGKLNKLKQNLHKR